MSSVCGGSVQLFLWVEQTIMSMMEIMMTTRQQKAMNFLLVSCWYQLASVSRMRPSLRFILAFFIFSKPIYNFSPCALIMILVFVAISLIWLMSRSISTSSCFSCMSILYRTACLSAYSSCPDSCSSLMAAISIEFSVVMCFYRSAFMQSNFFLSSSGSQVSMNYLLSFLTRSHNSEDSLISPRDSWSSLQQLLYFSNSAMSGTSLLRLFSACMLVRSRLSFSMEEMMDPPSFSMCLSRSCMLLALFISMKVVLFLRERSFVII